MNSSAPIKIVIVRPARFEAHDDISSLVLNERGSIVNSQIRVGIAGSVGNHDALERKGIAGSSAASAMSAKEAIMDTARARARTRDRVFFIVNFPLSRD